jgi:AAA domain
VRTLFFDAVAGNAKVALPLKLQTETTLRPFGEFLDQAIRTARQRPFRYQLPWARVGGAQITLVPIDKRVLVPHRQPGWRVTNWPADVPPPTKKLMVVSREIGVVDVECGRDADGVWIVPDRELRDDDLVFWEERQCTIVPEPPPGPPTTVLDSKAKLLLLGVGAQADERGWILVLRDWSGNGDLVVDGRTVTPRRLPQTDGLRWVRDSAGRSFEPVNLKITEEDSPAEGLLVGDNGVRFEQRIQSGGRRSGSWIELLLPETEDVDAFLDPRAAFCEDEVNEVRTGPGGGSPNKFAVKKVDRDHYQLRLDRFPPPGTLLSLPVNVNNLELQRRALRQLVEAPLPHHAGLLRLCENPDKVQWPTPGKTRPIEWAFLTDETRDGTTEQRVFVMKALSSPDIAMLEGPPGSGKTTAICEIVQQLVADGQRVLLCASTHTAIDNVLERLIEAKAPVDAVRIGHPERVDPNVQDTQLDLKIAHLVETWRSVAHLRALGENELQDMARRVVVSAANLTCGTTMGIAQHPLFRTTDQNPQERRQRPITTMPHWDVLIIDEASKTLIQEFLVPALMAKRCIVVGDVHQLPPFAERADLVANLRCLQDDRRREVFPADHQRACLVRHRLARPDLRRTGPRWLIVEPPGVLDWLGRELLAEAPRTVSAVRVVSRSGSADAVLREVTVDQLRDGARPALALAAHDWVLVSDDLLPAVSEHLPANLLHHRDLTTGRKGVSESDPLLFRHAWWLAKADSHAAGKSFKERDRAPTTYQQVEIQEQRWLTEHDLATELAWRLLRLHELKHSTSVERGRLAKGIEQLVPRTIDISGQLADLEAIGLPSILEVLQEGIGERRSGRASALTEGMPLRQRQAFQARFGSLRYQHRMHPAISKYPRKTFYEDDSLHDANTIQSRDAELEWNFGDVGNRRVIWADVHGHEVGATNLDEVRVVKGIVEEFIEWAAQVGPPRRRSPPVWEVACLAFYNKQAQEMSRMLQKLTGDSRHARFTVGNVEIVCGTVDKFQGREADLVLLSMRNTNRIGFLDSRNRMNVALTRARQQLVVVGNGDFFRRCKVDELKGLVSNSSPGSSRNWSQGSR